MVDISLYVTATLKPSFKGSAYISLSCRLSYLIIHGDGTSLYQGHIVHSKSARTSSTAISILLLIRYFFCSYSSSLIFVYSELVRDESECLWLFLWVWVTWVNWVFLEFLLSLFWYLWILFSIFCIKWLLKWSWKFTVCLISIFIDFS